MSQPSSVVIHMQRCAGATAGWPSGQARPVVIRATRSATRVLLETPGLPSMSVTTPRGSQASHSQRTGSDANSVSGASSSGAPQYLQ